MALVRRLAAVAMAALVVASASAAPAANAEGGADVVEPSSGIMGGLHVLYNSLSQCESSEDMGSCLKLKAIRSLERALAADRLELVDGVALAKSEGVEAEGGRSLPPPFEERALPQEPAQKQEVLDALLADRAHRLFSTRSLSFAVPRALRRLVEGAVTGAEEDSQAEGEAQGMETGRGRKKGHGILYLGLLWKGWMTLMAYKGVALLAGKALMTATIALVLAGILALSKLTHHEKQHTTVEIVRHPHVTHSYSHSASHEHVDDGHHGWGRALEEEQRRRQQRGGPRDADATASSAQAQVTQPGESAQQLAYRAYHQRQLQQQQQQQQYQYQSQPQQPVLQPQGEAMTVPL